MTNNRDIRDTDTRDKRDYETRNKDDMSWLFPALIGLLVLGAIAYYFMRHRMPVAEKPALPAAASTVTTEPTPAHVTVTTPSTPINHHTATTRTTTTAPTTSTVK